LKKNTRSTLKKSKKTIPPPVFKKHPT